MARVFISYNSQDRPFILKIAAQLQAAEHDVWLDVWRISGRVPYWEEIKAGIEQCTHFVFAISPQAIESESGSRIELDHAAGLPSEKRPIIAPLLVRKTPLEALPITISAGRLHIHDFVNKPFEAMLSNVLHAVASSKTESASKLSTSVFTSQRAQKLRYTEAIALVQAGAYEQAIASLEELAAQGYRPTMMPLERVLNHARQRMMESKRRAEAEDAYEEIAALEGLSRDLAREAWAQFRHDYPEFTDDPLNLAARLSRRNGQTTVRHNVADLLPDFEWRSIPQGVALLEDATNLRKYNPQGSRGGWYDVPAFKIAKTPITNLQYQYFLDAPDGYRDMRWWSYSLHASAWRRKRPQAKLTAVLGDRLPRTRISWFDAIAFCLWLSHRSGQHITLPTEVQWQRAAQGDDGRRYPYGNTFDETRCNVRESGHGAPTPVDAYPKGVSPYGVLDMQGNVWEWCLTEWQTDSAHVEGGNARALRGGAWSSVGAMVNCFYRYQNIPSVELDSIGFRPVLLDD